MELNLENLGKIGFKNNNPGDFNYELIIFKDKFKEIKLNFYKSNIEDYLYYLEISEFDYKKTTKSIEVQFNDTDEILKFIQHIKGRTYGTKDSNLLKAVIKAGLKPILITTMLCEETFVFKTKEEAHKGWELFEPEGWWYALEDNEWEKTKEKYINDFYDGKSENFKIYYL